MQTTVVTRSGAVRPESVRRVGDWGIANHSEEGDACPLKVRRAWLFAACLGLIFVSALPYLPFLLLPLISDDYIQITLGRQYGPVESWDNLASDVLYRSRATSILLTHWGDQVFGPDAAAHRALNILVHAANVLLIALCGFWKRIGWRISVPAAGAFAILEQHQEAVVWSAALPELLVFTFSIASLMAWAKWLFSRRWLWCLVSVALFALALLSKESAVVVVPLAGLFWLLEARDWKAPVFALAAMGIVSALYSYGIFTAGHNHLHLKDGTFSAHAPFWKTLAFSMLKMMWPWGLLSFGALWLSGARRHTGLLGMAAIWVIVTLLPYSFLTYMPRVPSRHTYWASLGLAVVVGYAWVSLSRSGVPAIRKWAPLFALVFVAGNFGYLWTKKFDQYRRRAEPTEHFLRFAAQADSPVRVLCSPYGVEAYQRAAQIRLGKSLDFVSGPEQSVDRRDYCDKSKP
jgi:hypothetical protein